MRAVVIGHHLVAGREDAGGIQARDLLLHALQRLQRVAVLAHQNDTGDDLVLIVLADYSKPRSVTDIHIRHIGNFYRDGLARIEYDVADVVETAEKSQTANVKRLLADAH